LKEGALARAEERLAALTERNGQLKAEIQASRTNVEKRIEELNTKLQREQMERAVIDGALEGARKNNARLQSEVTALRASLRRDAPLDDAPMVPNAGDVAPRYGAKRADLRAKSK
jgi:crescentin